MTPEQNDLWERIQAFPLDNPHAASPMSHRLARENGWDRVYTLRVLDEYRRFLFLGCVAGHPVSPSQAIDEAWHTHLLYTESYWGELCPKVLGRPFHHSPSLGGSKESTKFDDWYEKTLESYTHWFAEPPPQDIWPAPGMQFADSKTLRINPADHWVIPKPFRKQNNKRIL